MKVILVVESPAELNLASSLAKLAGLDYYPVNVVFKIKPKNKPSIKLLRSLPTIDYKEAGYIVVLGETATRSILNKSVVNIARLRGRDLKASGINIPVRVTFGPEKILEDGFYYHKEHILKDLKNLVAPVLEVPTNHHVYAYNLVAIDTEYAKSGELLNVGVADGRAVSATEEVRNVIKDANWLVGHNIPGDIYHLHRNGLPVKEDWYKGKKILDSYLLAKLVDENKPKGSYGVEQLLLTEYNSKPWKEATDKKFKETGDAADWDPDEREVRCKMDAWASLVLARKFHRELVKDERDDTLIEIIHRIAMTLHRIGLAGAKVDLDYLRDFQQSNKSHVARLEMRVRDDAIAAGWYSPVPFSPTKDSDIRHLLFDLMGEKPINKTKTGLPSVNKVSLKQYPGMEVLLEYNKYQKLDSVYGSNLDSKLDDKGFLHFWIQQLGARTGRRSGKLDDSLVSTTNPQNWPPAAKKMIVSRFKGGKIGAFDYQSLEPVLYAWISQDANLYGYFYEGQGYLDICKAVLKKDIDKTSPIYRAVKSMTLGVFYNMQDSLMAINLWQGAMMDAPFRFSEDFMEHKKQTGVHRRKILSLFPGLVRYIEKQKLAVTRDGFIVCPGGFVRHLPHEGKTGVNFWRIINQAINAPVQHLASMVTGCAMVDCEEALLNKNLITYKNHVGLLRCEAVDYTVLINEVHDELTFDLHPATVEVDTELILETMRSPPSLKRLIPDFNINLKIEAKITDRWGGD